MTIKISSNIGIAELGFEQLGLGVEMGTSGLLLGFNPATD